MPAVHRRLREAARQREMEERERQTAELLKSRESSSSPKKRTVRGAWAVAKN